MEHPTVVLDNRWGNPKYLNCYFEGANKKTACCLGVMLLDCFDTDGGETGFPTDVDCDWGDKHNERVIISYNKLHAIVNNCIDEVSDYIPDIKEKVGNLDEQTGESKAYVHSVEYAIDKVNSIGYEAIFNEDLDVDTINKVRSIVAGSIDELFFYYFDVVHKQPPFVEYVPLTAENIDWFRRNHGT